MLSEKYEKFSDMVIYEIYPKSFKDSNGDGIGDLRGIIEKIDYLYDLGVNAVWLCPCYKSPYYDNGYDISDYRSIAPEFGTMDDIKELISKLHAKGMKLIMDLVANHTSSEHEWFEASRNREGKYSDYYYWFDKPVNGWNSQFGGSAWEYDEVRKQYYLHCFAIQQPDLNWDNPEILKEIRDVVDFWVDMGVDGFRCDVIHFISKDIPNGKKIFGPHFHEYVNALFGREKTENIFTVGECSVDNTEELKKLTSSERGELSTLFQFEHIELNNPTKFAEEYTKDLKMVRDRVIKRQIETQDNDLLYSIFTDNHDQNLFISKVGNDKELRYETATCIAAMFYLLRGVPFIYQGQEIGITGSEYDDISEFRDVESINMYQSFLDNGLSKDEALKKINLGSRDNPRRPFAWDNSIYGGFSEHEPWIPCATRVKEINLENDLKSEKSVFEFYKNVLKLRREHLAFRKGIFSVISKPEDNYFIYQREFEGEKFTVVCNFETSSKIPEIKNFGTAVLHNYNDYDENNICLRPYETVVFKS